MKYFYYIDDESVIRIKSTIKPYKRRKPWPIRAFDGKSWSMPCFPEITWSRLSSMQFLGSLPIEVKP